MQREIRFRGKYKRTGDWVNGSYVSGTDLEGNPFSQIEHADANEHRVWEVEPETAGQFTGLIDNGCKDIYEGDILKTDLSDGQYLLLSVHFGDTYGLMKPEESYYGWYCKYIGGTYKIEEGINPYCQLNSSCSLTTIVGNIHDNPDLIHQ